MTFVSIPIPPGASGDPEQTDLPPVALPSVLGTQFDSSAAPEPLGSDPTPAAAPGTWTALRSSVGPIGQGTVSPGSAPTSAPLPDLTPDLQALSVPGEPGTPSVSGPAAKPAAAQRTPSVRARSAVQRSRPPGAPGLTAPGVVVIVFAGSLVGLLLDVFTGGGVGWLFGGIFVATSAYAAFQVRRADRAAAIIAPPLVFAVLVMADKFVGTTGDALAKSVGALNALLDYGPMLWIGCGLTVLIVGFKMWQERRPGAISGPAEVPAAVRTADAPPPS